MNVNKERKTRRGAGQRVYIKYGNDPYGNGNGVETWYKYDPARRWLTDIVTKSPRGNVTYQDISYELDAVGNVKGYRNNGDMHMTSQRYEYDDLYQLVAVHGESVGHPGTGLPAYNSNYTQTFAFDSIGNMTDKTSSSLYSTVQPPGANLNYKLQYEYLPGTHKAGRIGDTYYGYDGNGNLITEQAGSPVAAASNTMRVSEEGGVYSTEYGFALRSREGGEAETATTTYRRDYTWNERNLLQRSADRQYHVEYRYGADGQRAVKFAQGGGVATETRYFNQMLHTSSGVTGELVSKHIYVGETRIVTKRRQAGNENYGQEYKSQYFYHGDHLGSAQLVTDSEGKVYEHLEYTPYGELWVDRSVSATGNSPTPFRFTGKEFDPETGLYYYGARYLDPKTSRWISADPALGEYVPLAPVNDEAKRYNQNLPGMGGVFNTVNLHVYHYAGNNPVKYTDPNGKWILVDDLIIACLIKLFNKDSDIGSIWSLTKELLKHSWSNSFVDHFNALKEIVNDLKPSIEKAISDGELDLNENVKLSEKGITFRFGNADLSINVELPSKFKLTLSTRERKRMTNEDQEKKINDCLDEGISRAREKREIE
jgi:RHS repeat-associated protein